MSAILGHGRNYFNTTGTVAEQANYAIDKGKRKGPIDYRG